MEIYIPSRGRAHKTLTYGNLPPQAKARALHVVPPDELGAYRKAGLPAVACPAVGIGPVRQWICDKHDVKTQGESLLMLDDDLYFSERRKDDISKFAPTTPRSMDQMFKALDTLALKYAHGGIAPRDGANRETQRVSLCTRNLRALFYNVAVMRRHKIRFDRLPVMEDFDVALQLLEAGYPSAKLNSWVQDQRGSNAAGGCSIYRTMEVQAEGARGLARLHPDSVTVVEKPPLKSGGWSGQARLDVRVQWKKALKV